MARMLIIEDDVAAAELTLRRLEAVGLRFAAERVQTEAEFREALGRAPDVILSDSNVAGFSGLSALAIARRERPQTPFIFVSGNAEDQGVRRALNEGAAGFVSKADAAALTTAVRTALRRTH